MKRKHLAFDLIFRVKCATWGKIISTIMQSGISFQPVGVKYLRVLSFCMKSVVHIAVFHIFSVHFLNTHSSLIWNFEFQTSSKINVISRLIVFQRHQKYFSPFQDFQTKIKTLSYFKPSYTDNPLELKINGHCLINQYHIFIM